jgi:hypothetical protein
MGAICGLYTVNASLFVGLALLHNSLAYLYPGLRQRGLQNNNK